MERMTGGVKNRTLCVTYRWDNEEFAAHQVKDSDRTGAVSVRQQSTIVTPRYPAPVRVWILGYCSRKENRNVLKS